MTQSAVRRRATAPETPPRTTTGADAARRTACRHEPSKKGSPGEGAAGRPHSARCFSPDPTHVVHNRICRAGAADGAESRYKRNMDSQEGWSWVERYHIDFPSVSGALDFQKAYTSRRLFKFRRSRHKRINPFLSYSSMLLPFQNPSCKAFRYSQIHRQEE